MEYFLAIIELVASIHFFGGGFHSPKIGKTLYVEVQQNQVVDADYLEKVLEYEDKRSSGDTKDTDYEKMAFSILGLYRQHARELIDFMRKNNLKIAPGLYHFNQGWEFKDGKFIINHFIGQTKVEVFKFQKK